MTPTDGLPVSSRVTLPEALDRATIDAVIDALLGADPPPRVMAFNETGLGTRSANRGKKSLEFLPPRSDVICAADREEASILDALEEVMGRPARADNGVAVVFVDLDRFKTINDDFGHAAGDELLRLTGERLCRGMRKEDIVGRLGRDEFLIVCPNVPSPDLALALAERIRAAVQVNSDLGVVTVAARASVGVAWTAGRIECDSLVASADEALYKAKRAAAGPVCVVLTRDRHASLESRNQRR
jgi:diguanylate cyclase (GGDEF)-like protein